MTRGDVLKGGKVQGSYTVEAAWIVSISLTVIMSALMLSFSVYHKALEEVEMRNKMSEVSAVELFRGADALDGLWESLLGE